MLCKPSLTLSLINFALLATVCGCNEALTTTGKFAPDSQGGSSASNTNDTTQTGPARCNPELQLEPTISTAAMTSHVVPGAYACEITTDPAGLLVSACASAVASAVGVNAIPAGQNGELFVEKRATDGTAVFHTPIPGIAPIAIASSPDSSTYVMGALDPIADKDDAYALVKLSTTGNIVWNKKFYKLYDGTAAYGALAVAIDGTLWVTGSTDFIAAQYDSSGNELQRIEFPRTSNPGWGSSQAIQILLNGDILVAGVFMNSIDFGGGPLGNATDNLYSGFLARYSASGKHVTSQTFATNTGVQEIGLAADPSGNPVLTGALNGIPSVFGCSIPQSGVAPGFVAKLDASLATRWVTFTPMGAGRGAAVDSQGNITLAGKSPDNVYLMTLDSSGANARAWTTVSGFAASYRVVTNAAGITFVSGSFMEDVSFGPTQISTDRVSAFLLSVNPQ